MSIIHRRNAQVTPSFRIGTDVYDHNNCALLYILDNGKLASSGGQPNGANMTPFEMIKNTHENYGGGRAISGNLDLEWGWVHLDLIPKSRNIKNKQFDKPLRKHLKKQVPTIKYNINNKEFFDQIYPNEEVTAKSIIKLLEDTLGKSHPGYAPHSGQIADKIRVAKLINDHTDVEFIHDFQNRHTRFGKDKNNSFHQGYQINLLPTGFFATWQIETELPHSEHAFIETRGKTHDKIVNEILIAVVEGKTIWLAMSTYKQDFSRFKFLELFKNTDVRSVFDEPDLHVHRQDKFIAYIADALSASVKRTWNNLTQDETTLINLLSKKQKPRLFQYSAGTGIYKIMHGVKESSILVKFSNHVELTSVLQADSEWKKINGDLSLSHILHRTTTIVEYDPNDFAVANLPVPLELQQDYDKLWNGGDRNSICDLLSLWLDRNNALYAGNIVNNMIDQTLQKFETFPIGYEATRYNNRVCFGGYIRTAIDNINRYNQIIDQFQIGKHLALLGIYLIASNAKVLKENGFSGKQELNLYFQSCVKEYKAVQQQYPNGFVVLAPSWAYAARSMSTLALDYTLDLTNSVNSQERDRDMTATPLGIPCTLDGKEKLVGCQIRAPFVTHNNSVEFEQAEYISNYYNEVKEAHGDKLPEYWRTGINLAKRVLGSTSYQVIQSHEIDNVINSSARILNACIQKPNYQVLLAIPGMIEILSKVNTDRPFKNRTTILGKIKKKVLVGSKAKKQAPASSLSKTEEQKLREMQFDISKTLIGGGIYLFDKVKNKNVVDCLLSIDNQHDLASAFETILGISPTEYKTVITATDNHGNYVFPIADMNLLLEEKSG